MGHRLRMSRPAWIGLAAMSAAFVGAGIGFAFERDLAAARRRISGRSEVIRTRFGALEYAAEGDGAPLLMVHGSGGGFDQGLAMTRPLIGMGHRVIAPSRFGYLRSDFPNDPSPANQADAFAELLDHLRIDRLPVCGGSAGALSALQFALRHPQRCGALVLVVPAAWAPERVPVAWDPLAERLVAAALGSDLLFWFVMKAAPSALVRNILATDPALLDRAVPAERRRVRDILENILPVSGRRHGLLNDTRLAGNPARVSAESVRARTLILSLEDDRYGTAAAARDLASRIPDAELVIFPSGGHVWIGREAQLWGAVDGFLRRHRRWQG